MLHRVLKSPAHGHTAYERMNGCLRYESPIMSVNIPGEDWHTCIPNYRHRSAHRTRNPAYSWLSRSLHCDTERGSKSSSSSNGWGVGRARFSRFAPTNPSRIVKASQMDGEEKCCYEIQYKKAYKRLMVAADHFVLFVGFELD